MIIIQKRNYIAYFTCRDGLEKEEGRFDAMLGFLLEKGRLAFDLLLRNPKLSLVGHMLCFFCPFLGFADLKLPATNKHVMMNVNVIINLS